MAKLKKTYTLGSEAHQNIEGIRRCSGMSADSAIIEWALAALRLSLLPLRDAQEDAELNKLRLSMAPGVGVSTGSGQAVGVIPASEKTADRTGF